MSDQAIQLMHGDCLLLLPMLPDNSVDLILTDPPYMGVKSEDWDNQWSSSAAFLGWLGEVLKQFHRVLRPNGSLYLFASPQMAARVECKVGETFNVLNHIVWQKEKDRGKHAQSCKEVLRGYFPNTERIIFAEHFGADNMAKGEAGYEAKCDELRGFVFEPLRAYLAKERDRAGFTTRCVAEHYQKRTGSRTVTGMAGHWFEQVPWALPTLESYHWLQSLFNAHESQYLRREYEDLRREYEDLRREYEDLRRPFGVSADVPYTDVWDFETVGIYPGKHPCEKPLPLLRHIITSSSRPGAVVLDAFAGSASTGVACLETGRQFIGMEQDANYYRQGQIRLTGQTLSLFTV